VISRALESLLESPLRVVIAVGLLVGTPVLMLGQISDANARSRLAADEASITVETAQRAADLISTQVATTSAQLGSAVANDPGYQTGGNVGLLIGRGDAESLTGLLRQLQGQMVGGVRRLFVAGRDGRVIAAAPRDDQLTGSSVAAQDYFRSLIGDPSRAFVMSAVYRLDTPNAPPGFTIAYPVLTIGGTSAIGILVGEVDLQYLAARLSAFRSSVEDVYVIDGSGQLVGQAAVTAVGTQNPNLYRPIREDPALRTLVVGRATDAPDPLGRGRRLLASALVRDTPWQVVAVRDPSLLERETDAALLQLTAFRIALVGIVLLGSYLLARVTRRVVLQRKALAASNERIADANRQLAAATEAKTRFLANMSHELRTPLNAIIGFADVLGQRMFGELNAKQSDYLADISTSGRHLLNLVNEVLDLSKVEAGRMELEPSEFAVADTIRGALAFVRERATHHGIALTDESPANLGTLVADERKVRQVLLNLLSNAVKFTPDGGAIGVRARRSDGEIQVSIRDTGIGIAPEDQAKVFDEFQQVGRPSDRSREGTGLGLTLAKRFIELHGGRIWIESELGKGTTFTFAIPVGRAAAAPA
jgi:signal transduction histidine kinase